MTDTGMQVFPLLGGAHGSCVLWHSAGLPSENAHHAPPRGLQHRREQPVLYKLSEHSPDKTSAVRLPSDVPQKPGKQDANTLQWQLTQALFHTLSFDIRKLVPLGTKEVACLWKNT